MQWTILLKIYVGNLGLSWLVCRTKITIENFSEMVSIGIKKNKNN